MFNLHLYLDFVYRLSNYWTDDVQARSFCRNYGDQVSKLCQRTVRCLKTCCKSTFFSFFFFRGKKLIKERRQFYQNLNAEQKNQTQEASNDFAKEPKIFVDHLIESKVTKFTDKEIRDHVLTILSAVGNFLLIFLGFFLDFSSK